ncbi:MAG: hypothetical protein FD174_1238 [Geobacteraceae bacterium]|nr:MAG: hypothetical protein FD174_1238 [Geobacteraceae bacterium]
MKNVLIIFAKRPTPGRVKTRLAATLSAEDAAELYRCMLFDTLAKAKELAGPDKLVFYEPAAGAAAYFKGIAAGMETCPQEGNDLGKRMENAFKRTLEMGYEAAVIIGTDSPDLPSSFIEEAFAMLESRDIDAVFGPSEDGGYYLIAMKRLQGELFKGIPWSSGAVLEKSLEKAAEAGIRVSLLPRWYDVDTFEDLQRPELLEEANGAPLTREFLTSRLGAALISCRNSRSSKR